MLVELSVVEQKYQAVLAVIGDGREVTHVASLSWCAHSARSWLCQRGLNAGAGRTAREAA